MAVCSRPVETIVFFFTDFIPTLHMVKEGGTGKIYPAIGAPAHG